MHSPARSGRRLAKWLRWPLIPAALCLVWVTGTACSGNSKPKCENTCSSAGATSCEGALIETCGKQANGCLGWSTPSACPANQSCQGTACACNIPCGNTCCGAGEGCIDGACCPDPCGDTCGCTAPLTCAQEGNGRYICALPCTTSIECGAIDPDAGPGCCGVQPDGGGACIPPPPTGKFVCACGTANDCQQLPATPICAPDTTQGEGGPYVCAPLDGSNNGGCGFMGAVLVRCETPGDDCWLDAMGNSFCTQSCGENAPVCPTGAVCNTNAVCNNQGQGCNGQGTVPLDGGCMPPAP